jgi:superfamily II DNA or RNA helicase
MLLDNKLGCPTWVKYGKNVHVLVGALLYVKDSIETIDKSTTDILAEPLVGGVNAEKVQVGTSQLLVERILRPYQADMIKAALLAPMGRGVLQAPPGAGKTIVAAGLFAIGATAGYMDWLYVVHNEELVWQSLNKFHAVLPKMCEVLEVQQPSISCVTYGGIKDKRLAAGVVVDECHGLPAETRATAYSKISSYFKIGMSATPLDRSDDRNGLVIGFLGPVINVVDKKVLEDLGYLAKCTVEHLDWKGRN